MVEELKSCEHNIDNVKRILHKMGIKIEVIQHGGTATEHYILRDFKELEEAINSLQLGKDAYQSPIHSSTQGGCPNCGYCPCCGKQRYNLNYPLNPTYPIYPYWQGTIC